MTLAPRRLCVIIAITYSTWIIAPLLDPGLHPWTSYASEYFVANRPAATLLRTTDGVSGVLLVVIAVLSYTRARILWRGLPVGLDDSSIRVLQAGVVPHRRRLALKAWYAALGCAGLATVVDAINPMTCPPSISHACAAAETADTLPLQHELHTVSSAIAGVAFVVAMAVSLLLAAGTNRLVRVASWAGIVTITLSGIDALVTRIPTEGITQRISMVAIVVWLVAASSLPVLDRHVSEAREFDDAPAR